MKGLSGWVGTALLACCALPLLLATIAAGNANGIDSLFLALWLGGEVSMLVHVFVTDSSLPLRLNYITNTFMVMVIGMYRWLG